MRTTETHIHTHTNARVCASEWVASSVVRMNSGEVARGSSLQIRTDCFTNKEEKSKTERGTVLSFRSAVLLGGGEKQISWGQQWEGGRG